MPSHARVVAENFGRGPTPGLMIGLVAVLWALSDAGFYYFLPAIGWTYNFDTSPVAASFYYFFWALLTALLFWPAYHSWFQQAAAANGQNPASGGAALFASFLACITYAAYVLPQFPAVAAPQSPDTQVYKMATSIFFLPKSIEIVFQQLLFAAVVIALSARQLSLVKIAAYSALLFGGAHALLALDGVSFFYVAAFMAAATGFGFVFPYLVLRVPRGVPIAYTVHWMFYAAVAAMLHLSGA